MDDRFLMRVLDALADLHEQLQAVLHRQAVLVAVFGDRQPLHVLHHEVRAAFRRRAGFVHLRDVRVIHQREGLALGLEPRHHGPGVHARLYQLHRDGTLNRRSLFRQPHLAHPAFAEHAQQPVRPNPTRARGGGGAAGVRAAQRVGVHVPFSVVRRIVRVHGRDLRVSEFPGAGCTTRGSGGYITACFQRISPEVPRNRRPGSDTIP